MDSKNKYLVYITSASILSIVILSLISYNNSFSVVYSLLFILVILLLAFLGFNKNNEELKAYNEKEDLLEKEENDDEFLQEFLNLSNSLANSDFSKTIDTQAKNQNLEEIKNNINKMITNMNVSFSDMKNYFELFQKNDFTQEINNLQQEDLKAILEIINKLNVKISRMLLSSLKSGTRFKANADALNANINNLTNNIETQAEQLEQTSNHIDKITSIVKDNSKSVQDMLTNTQELTNSVSSGYDKAKNSALYMDKINEKTKSIEEAITVIDQIAFQTNILSLNAAVEAATAGEAGKGFAVVAQEVRNLATRSAEAAKEIKFLVESATNETTNGKQASSEMINDYNLLSENISKTKNLIEDISNSLKEQEKGIEEVNNSVAQIDKATKQNAQNAQNTKSISDQNDEMATKMVIETNKTNFFGRDEFNKNQ